MPAMLIEIDPDRPNPRRIQAAVESLKKGGVIVYPTDTCYGIGVDIFNKEAIEKVYAIKGAKKDTPFSFVCADLANISHYAYVTDFAYRTLRRFLPGPFTFVLQGSRQVPKMMLTKRKTVGIRIPDHPVCMAIVNGLENPILSATASIRGSEPLADPYEIRELLGKQVGVIIDCGIIAPEPSTVVSLMEDRIEILRAGKRVEIIQNL